MGVRRIVANIAADDLAAGREFYGTVFGLDVLMDLGWIITLGNADRMTLQLSVMREGGSGAPVPDLSIEVDDLDAILDKLQAAGHPIEYGPAREPWGVRRFFVRDPFGKLVNVLVHL
ncbi:VOC family protein [Pararhizobium haloflavum]|uniref:VOC family protein n=1 Tax=Pararhizobium haloflavum TaxID=2037914 RepID=UPI000C174050|nr:VOC family protein [Pararhizobium haloflavum]